MTLYPQRWKKNKSIKNCKQSQGGKNKTNQSRGQIKGSKVGTNIVNTKQKKTK